MPNVLDLRRRIRSVRNTRQITKAMKMVAAAKLRRAQERMTNARPYAVMLATVLASLRRRLGNVDEAENTERSPLLATREEKTVLLVVISGDKGFAGAFSTNIVRSSTQFVAEREGTKKIDVLAVGRRGRDFFRRRYPAAEFAATPEGAEGSANGPEAASAPRPARRRAAAVEFVASGPAAEILLDKLRFEQARAVSEEVVASYAAGEVDAVYLCYNQFQSVLSQRVVVERVLPLVEREGALAGPEIAASVEQTKEERERVAQAALSAGLSLRDDEQAAIRAQYEDESKRFGTAEVDYLYDQSAGAVYQAMLPRFVAALLYYAMLESVASEHAARMTAMDSATSNASDMIDALTLTMNRVRQAAITKEIIEIVSGASAV